MGNGTVNTSDLQWTETNLDGSYGHNVENSFNVTNSMISTWPSTNGTYSADKGGYVLSKETSHWNAIFGAYKEDIRQKLGVEELNSSDVTDIILTPFKVSRYNKVTNDKHYHVDCTVEVKCDNFATATFKLWNDETRTYKSYSAANYRKGTSVVFPKVETKPEYTFSGWYLDEDLTGSALDKYTIENNVTFYAKYTPKTYTVTFNAGNNGKLDQDKSTVTKTGTSGTSLSAPATNPNDGYEFAGWVEGNDTTVNTVKIPTTITKDVTYTATWREKTYTVTFNAGDNGKLDQDKSTVTKTGTSGTPLAAPETNPDNSYEFAGWVEGNDTTVNTVKIPTTITKDVTYTATWREKTYTVTFNAGDNGKLDQDKSTVTKTGTSGTPLAAPATNANDGYEFAAWVKDNTPVNAIPATITENAIYTATWREKTYTVTFNAGDNGKLDQDKSTVIKTGKSGTPLAAPATNPNNGYKFAGWVKNSAPVTLPNTITEDATYTATWTATEPSPTTAQYTVKHYKWDTQNKKYTLADTDVIDSTVGTDVTARAKDYTDYTLNTQDSTLKGKVMAGNKLTLDLYYDIDKIGSGNNKDKPDKIPDRYQVTINYVSSNTNWGSVNRSKEVITLINTESGKWLETGRVTAPSCTATSAGGKCYFVNWTKKQEGTTDVSTVASTANLPAKTFDAKGGDVYTFTANFDRSSGGGSGGSSRPSTPPTVDIPDDVPTGLNGKDHYAYIIGYGNNDVRPQNNITRAEVATIFFRLLTDETREANMTKSNGYNDVKDGDWFCCAVSTLSKMGIIKGYEDGSFKPNDPISRAEFAAIAARFDPDGDKTPASFSDVTSHWAKDEISIAANHGWIKGYEDGSFKPDQKITRAETMTLVNRVLNRLPETKDDLHKDMKTWVDNMDETAWYYLAVQEATNSHYFKNKTGTKFEQWTDLRDTRDWSELEK